MILAPLPVLPGDPGYGAPVLGLHLSSWSFVVFVTALVVSGLNLTFAEALRPRGVRVGWFSWLTVGLLAAVVLANAVAVYCEEGLHWTLPDDPQHYRLFQDLGRGPANR